jgi:hypothetical protein
MFSKAQCFFKRFADYVYISVLTKNQRHYNPIIGSAYLSVRARITHKRFIFPPADIRSLPLDCFGSSGISRSFMFYILSGNGTSLRDEADCFPNYYTVHDNFFTRLKRSFNKFMLG